VTFSAYTIQKTGREVKFFQNIILRPIAGPGGEKINTFPEIAHCFPARNRL
jgi:hypothetical protein